MVPAPDSVLTPAQRKKLAASLDARFLSFMTLGDGASIGLWDDDGKPSETSQVIQLGAHGDHFVLAPDLVTFLWRIARQDFKSDDQFHELLPQRVYQQLDGAEDDELDAEPGEAGSKLLAWLESASPSKVSLKKFKASKFKSKVYQDLESQICFRSPEQEESAVQDDEKSEEAIPRIENPKDPLMKQISKILKPYQKEGCVMVYAAGPHMVFYFAQMTDTEFTKKVPPEVAEHIQLPLKELREDFARFPGLSDQPQGQWTEVILQINSDGVSAYPAVSEDPFPMGLKEFPDSYFKQDHKKFPWPTDDLPEWIARKIK